MIGNPLRRRVPKLGSITYANIKRKDTPNSGALPPLGLPAFPPKLLCACYFPNGCLHLRVDPCVNLSWGIQE